MAVCSGNPDGSTEVTSFGPQILRDVSPKVFSLSHWPPHLSWTIGTERPADTLSGELSSELVPWKIADKRADLQGNGQGFMRFRDAHREAQVILKAGELVRSLADSHFTDENFAEDEDSTPQWRKYRKASSLNKRETASGAVGCVILAGNSMLMPVPKVFLLSDEHKVDKYGLYPSRFKPSSAQMSCDPRHANCVHICSEVWFNSYLLNSLEDKRWMSKLHMRRATFLWICKQLELDCRVKDSELRPSIPVASQLGGTLYYLMTAAPYHDVAKKFGIEGSSVANIIEKCVHKIVKCFGHYLRWPTDDEMLDVSRKFYQKWSLPNCHGVLGTTRVNVLPDENNVQNSSGDDRAGHHSIAIQAVCDSAGVLLNAYCAYPGTLSNNAILQSSGLCARATSGHVLSEPSLLLDSGDTITPYLLADSSYKSSRWLLVPESWNPSPQLLSHRNTLIHRHRQGRSSVEDAFAELRQVFRSLSLGISCKLQAAPTFLHACCILYNMLLLEKDAKAKGLRTFFVDPLESLGGQGESGSTENINSAWTGTGDDLDDATDLDSSSDEDDMDGSSGTGEVSDEEGMQ